MGGGASLQFSMVPMNFLGAGQTAAYAVTSNFSDKAVKEAEKVGKVVIPFSSKAEKYIKDRSKLETQPHLLRPNMEQQITGSRNSCILLPFYLGESTQLFRFTLIGEKPRPRISPESHRATELLSIIRW